MSPFIGRSCWPRATGERGAEAAPYLWITQYGAPPTAEGFAQIVCNETAKAFGKPVPPHFFRDSVMTSWAMDLPKQVLGSKHLLGNRSFAVVESAYNMAGSSDAAAKLQQTIAALRQDTNGRHRSLRPRQIRHRKRRSVSTMRAVIYARYSSDLQRDASVEDQIRLCRERIAHDGWQLITTYTDRAQSGASPLRAGYQRLLEDARRGQFDVVVAEALDRLSRDQEHVAALFKHLTFAGVRIVTLAEGDISELHVGLKGTMNALFLKDLAAKTRRGLRGRVEAGRSAGGNAYGYDVVVEHDARGERVRGGRTINESEAMVVRRILAAFAAGHSPRAIARVLNTEGMPGPGGRPWSDTTIRGHATRRTGSCATTSMPAVSSGTSRPT